MSNSEKMYDVAIVGAGPAGIIAANLCGIYGLSAIAFDRATDVYDLPRAVGLWDDVQRILDNARVLDSILPSTCLHEGAEFVDSQGKRIIGFDMPEVFLTGNGHPPLRGFHQPDFERAARACVKAYKGVDVRVGTEVTDIEQSDTEVSFVAREVAGGASESFRAKWLIGCDGAVSSVRRHCGISWDSLGYDREWLVVDVTLGAGVELSKYATQICDPARPTTLVPGAVGTHRWEFQLLDDETKEEMEDRDRVWSLLAPWVTPADADILRAVVYRFHATIADTFRRGRIFLAGDAAHQTPPFMGQGLSSGLRDVDNLIWKLDHVERGLAGDALLDTYTEERHPMAVAMVNHSVNTGKLIDAYADMERGGAEPSAQLQRYAYGGDAQLPHLGAGLLASGGSNFVGRLVPQCPVVTDEGSGMFDKIVRQRWAVLATKDPRDILEDDTIAYWKHLGAAFVSVPEPEGEMLGLLLTHELVIARPDRVIYAAGKASDTPHADPRLIA